MEASFGNELAFHAINVKKAAPACRRLPQVTALTITIVQQLHKKQHNQQHISNTKMREMCSTLPIFSKEEERRSQCPSDFKNLLVTFTTCYTLTQLLLLQIVQRGNLLWSTARENDYQSEGRRAFPFYLLFAPEFVLNFEQNGVT